MNEQNIFEVATRNKMRFAFKGLISVEDLWDLDVKSLDSIFQSLNSQLKQVKEESLLDAKTKQDKELEMKIDIIKHIFQVKTDEQNVRLLAKEKREQKQKIMGILATKQDQTLQNKSEEELQKMLEEL